MALLPLLGDDLLDLYRPSRILRLLNDDTEDLFGRKFRRSLLSSPYSRPSKQLVPDSQISTDKNRFQVNLDVQQFAPEEVSVKATGDNTITIEGKHEEKQDEHGYISRHFVRRYKVPKGHDLSKCVSKLSSDGVLTVTAPKVNTKECNEIEIPITFTNQPSRLTQKEASKEEEGSGDSCNCKNKQKCKKCRK